MQKLILGRVLHAPRPPGTAAGSPRGRSPAWGGPSSGGPALGPGQAERPLLIIANQPTWGLDIGAVAYVHQQLLDAAAAGSAVLVISEDLDEVFALADRIAVMHQGRLSAARPVAEWTLAQIGLAMAGAESESSHAAA